MHRFSVAHVYLTFRGRNIFKLDVIGLKAVLGFEGLDR